MGVQVAMPVVLTLEHVFWTQKIEVDGIEKMNNEPKSLKKVFQNEEAKLHELVELIKVPRDNQAHVMTLGALIILDVQAKDVTGELALAYISNLVNSTGYFILGTKFLRWLHLGLQKSSQP